MVTAPSFAAQTLALWTLGLLLLVGVASAGSAVAVRSARWLRGSRRWRLVPGTGPGTQHPGCPECGGAAVQVVHAHPNAANILRACVGKLVIVGSLPCPPPWACTACGCRFAAPAEVTPARRPSPPARPFSSFRSPDRAPGGGDGALARVVPLFGAAGEGRARERRRQPG